MGERHSAICKKNYFIQDFSLSEGKEYSYFLHSDGFLKDIITVFNHYNWAYFSYKEFEEYFYTIKEIRKQKLKNIENDGMGS